MASINYATREISCKIVYYGPGLSGKTTNLQIIHRKIPVEAKSEMVSLATETDRTLFFDFLPLDLGSIKGFATKFQLYTVPGQVYYNATRKLVLRGVDGVVFVADSQRDKMQENIDSLKNLQENLKEYGIDLATVPFVLQYNKRDLPGIASIVELDQHLNWHKVPTYEAQAHQGIGVFTTLKAIGKIVIDTFNSKYTARQSSRKPVSTSDVPSAAPTAPVAPPPRPVPAPPPPPTPRPAPVPLPAARPNPSQAPILQAPTAPPHASGFGFPAPTLPPLSAPTAAPHPPVLPPIPTQAPFVAPTPILPPPVAVQPNPESVPFTSFQTPAFQPNAIPSATGLQTDYFGAAPSAPSNVASVPGLQATVAPILAAPTHSTPPAGMETFAPAHFPPSHSSSAAPSTVQSASASQVASVSQASASQAAPLSEPRAQKKSKIDGSIDPSDLDAEIARYERELADQKPAIPSNTIITNPNVNPNIQSQDPLASAFLTPEELARLQGADSYPTRRMPLGPGQP
jgi:signal recognition particle receptor subunit beta